MTSPATVSEMPPSADGARPKPPLDRPVRVRTCLMLTALAPLGFALQAICALDPAATERVYARGIYPVIESVLATIASASPIPLGESMLLAGIAFVVVRVLRAILALRRRTRSLRGVVAHALAGTGAVAGVLVLSFQLLWGINHARLPFATQVGLETRPVVPSVLAQVVLELAERAAARRPADLQPIAGCLVADWREAVADAYVAAGDEWPVLAGPRPTIRGAWVSRVMTWSSLTGIYSPFTGEPNVNVHMPEVLRPFVACHEVAHLRGYAREDEANFIAWWVGSRSPDPVLAYSCELNAYRIASVELWSADFGQYIAILDRIPESIRADVESIRAFWLGQPAVVSKVLSTVSATTNDLYLKSSGHAEGVASYGRMVDLLVAALAD